MKLIDIDKTWRNTRPGIWHKPFMAKRGNKRVKEWAIYHEMICKGCSDKYVSPYKRVKYCTQLCQNQHNKQFGKNHWRWKGGKANVASGYIMVRESTGKYVFQHRLIMEQHLGRKLTNNEVTHHINGIRNDNRLKNLQLMTRKEHAHHHAISSNCNDLTQ